MADKHLSPEEDYFKQEELAKLRRLSKDKAGELAEKEREERKQLHWMQCPKCGMDLKEIEFRDVKVDTCFTCDGMFLDAGELDNILAHKEGNWFQSMANHLFGPDKD